MGRATPVLAPSAPFGGTSLKEGGRATPPHPSGLRPATFPPRGKAENRPLWKKGARRAPFLI